MGSGMFTTGRSVSGNSTNEGITSKTRSEGGHGTSAFTNIRVLPMSPD